MYRVAVGCETGTFLANCERERGPAGHGLAGRTPNGWDAIENEAARAAGGAALNRRYAPDSRCLLETGPPEPSELRFWAAMYLPQFALPLEASGSVALYDARGKS